MTSEGWELGCASPFLPCSRGAPCSACIPDQGCFFRGCITNPNHVSLAGYWETVWCGEGSHHTHPFWLVNMLACSEFFPPPSVFSILVKNINSLVLCNRLPGLLLISTMLNHGGYTQEPMLQPCARVSPCA